MVSALSSAGAVVGLLVACTAAPTSPTNSLGDQGPDAKLVFAHYFPPYPISIDNLPAERDYYSTEYLDPGGSGGANAAYGGLLRDRPVPRPVSDHADWRSADLETEVRQAIAAGIDGFTVNLLTAAGDGGLWHADVPTRLLRAAHAVDPNFKIMLMPDMSGAPGTWSVAQLAAELASWAGEPAAYRLSTGPLVVSPYMAEKRPAAWWSELVEVMSSAHGIEVALAPVFTVYDTYAADYAPISYAMSIWGGRNPAFNPISGFPLDTIGDAHSRGARWMQPVSVQDYRPRNGIFDEAGNTENLRNTWTIAIAGGADWVQLVTWNDHSEGTSFAPSMYHGSALLGLTSYYLRWFKSGRPPAIERDELYLTHRQQLAATRPTYPQSVLMTLRPGSTPARDEAEALVLLREPGTVAVRAGSQVARCTLPAGLGICAVSLPGGDSDVTVSAYLERAGGVVLAANSPWPVRAHPPVQDLQYTATMGVAP
ncbi:glycoside hydrolase family 71 protein [Nocardia sp. NPDC058497]|uniref:glycoside hydrolase family 71 protein n=1 Tax=Nocardia sp. NPDC058497 TaxID=3346529 RepID=UPI003651CD3B